MSKFDGYILGLEVDQSYVIDYEKIHAGGVRFLVSDAGSGEGEAVNASVGSIDQSLAGHVDGAYHAKIACGATWRLTYSIVGHTVEAMIIDQVPEMIRVLRSKSIGFLRLVVGSPVGITENNVLSITIGVADKLQEAYKAQYGKDLRVVISIKPDYYVDKPIRYRLPSRHVEVDAIASPGAENVACNWEDLHLFYPSDDYPQSAMMSQCFTPEFLFWTKTRFYLPGVTGTDGQPKAARLLFYAGNIDTLAANYGANLPAGSLTAPVVVVDPGEEEPEPETPVVDPPVMGTFEDQVLARLASIDASLKQITGR